MRGPHSVMGIGLMLAGVGSVACSPTTNGQVNSAAVADVVDTEVKACFLSYPVASCSIKNTLALANSRGVNDLIAVQDNVNSCFNLAVKCLDAATFDYQNARPRHQPAIQQPALLQANFER